MTDRPQFTTEEERAAYTARIEELEQREKIAIETIEKLTQSLETKIELDLSPGWSNKKDLARIAELEQQLATANAEIERIRKNYVAAENENISNSAEIVRLRAEENEQRQILEAFCNHLEVDSYQTDSLSELRQIVANDYMLRMTQACEIRDGLNEENKRLRAENAELRDVDHRQIYELLAGKVNSMIAFLRNITVAAGYDQRQENLASVVLLGLENKEQPQCPNS